MDKLLQINIQGMTKVTIHPEGDMDVCTKFHSNPSNSCWDISLKTIKCYPCGGAKIKVRGSSKSLGFTVWRPWMSVQYLVPVHPVDVELKVRGSSGFMTMNVCTNNSSEGSWDIFVWTKVVDWPTNLAVAIPRAMSLALLKLQNFSVSSSVSPRDSLRGHKGQIFRKSERAYFLCHELKSPPWPSRMEFSRQ